MAKGEKLEPETPIITQTKIYTGSFMRTGNLSEYIKIPIKKAGYSWRPYVLRRYFDTRMMLAESEGIIIRDWRVFWMGHVGNVDAEYTVNKGLSEDVIEKMREAYTKATDRYLVTTRKQDVTIDAVKAQFNRQFLEIAGYSEQEIISLGDLGRFTAEEVKKLLHESSKKEFGLSGNSQRVVALADLEALLAEGWEYVRELPGSKAIIKLPNGH